MNRCAIDIALSPLMRSITCDTEIFRQYAYAHKYVIWHQVLIQYLASFASPNHAIFFLNGLRIAPNITFRFFEIYLQSHIVCVSLW